MRSEFPFSKAEKKVHVFNGLIGLAIF